MPFRPPTRADADAVTAMLIACDIADFGAPDFDVDALLAEWTDVDLERDAFLDDGVYGHVVDNDARGWVHPERRGAGLGTALVGALEARARAKGLPHLDQQMPHSDAAGRALLEGRGWAYAHSYADLRIPDTAVEALPDSGAVRPYTDADADAAHAVMRDAFGSSPGRLESLESLHGRAADTSAWFVVEASGGEVVGAIRAELRAAGFIVGYLSAVGIAPSHRGHGLGGALIGAASRVLVGQGATQIRLFVRSSNPHALQLYQRLGFQGDWDVDEFRLTLG